MSNLNVIINDNFSINNLIEAKTLGYSVMRSAHVGNFSPYNLALAGAGVDFICVDHNMTQKDTSYKPELEIVDGVSNIISSKVNTVSCRTGLDSNQNISLDQHHMASLEIAFPKLSAVTNSQYLKDNEAVVSEIVDEAKTFFPQEFTRIVLADGRILSKPKGQYFGMQEVEKYGILQLSDDIRGEEEKIIMPLNGDIVANFAIEALRSGRDTQFHLSGPAMALYMNNQTRMLGLQSMYAAVRQNCSFGSRLPETLTVNLVRTTDAGFVTTMARAAKLTDMLAALPILSQQLQQIAEDRKSVAATKPTDKSSFSVFNQRKAKVLGQFAEQFIDGNELFIGPGCGGHITQYDVAAEGGLYSADINNELTMPELKSLYNRILNIRNGKFQS